jgi:hypothetical protein
METGREAVGLNFQGGLICNRWLAAGLHGNAFFTLSPLADRYSSDDVSLLGVYGGVFAAPIICPKAMIHASIPVCAGYGTVSYGLNEASKTDGRTEASSRIWVLEPGIEVELNLINFIRIAIGGYYRYCGNVKLGYGNENVAADIFNNFSVGIRLRFGKF